MRLLCIKRKKNTKEFREHPEPRVENNNNVADQNIIVFFLTLKLHEKFMKRIEMAAKKNDDKKKID